MTKPKQNQAGPGKKPSIENISADETDSLNAFPAGSFSTQFIYNLPMLVIVLDDKGVIRWVNNATLRTLQVERGKLIGQSLNSSILCPYTMDNTPMALEDLPTSIAYKTGKTVENVMVKVFLEAVTKSTPSLEKLPFVLLNLTATPVFSADAGQPSQMIVLAEDVTDRIKQSTRSDQDQKTFLNLFANVPVSIIIFSALRNEQGLITDLVIDEINQKAADISKSAVEQLKGQRISKIIPQPKLAELMGLISKVAETGQVVNAPPSAYLNRTYSTTVFALDNDHFVAMSADVTETYLQAVTEKRELSETRQILDVLPIQIYSTDAKGVALSANSNWHQYTGANLVNSTGMNWVDYYHPEDREALLREWNLCVAEAKPFNFEARLRSVSGEYKWFSLKAMPVVNSTGQAVKWYGANVDIDPQKQVEKHLAGVNQLFQDIAENITECFWVVDPRDGSLIYNSPSYKQILGYTPEERMNLPGGYKDVVHPEDWPVVAQAQLDEREGKTTRNQYRVIWPDGSIHWVAEISRPIVETDSTIQRVIGSVWDVTNEVDSLQALKESEERFKSLAENMNEGFWMSTDMNEILYLSPAIEEIFGQPLNQFHNLDDFQQLVHPEDVDKVNQAIHNQGDGRSSNIQFRIQQPAGKVVWVWDRSFPIRSEETKSNYIAGIITDITEQKLIELQMEELNHSLERRISDRTSELQALYDNAPIGYHSLGPKGNFLRVNRTELEWLGYSENEMLNMNFREILTPSSQAAFAISFTKFLAEKSAKDVEYDIIGKNGVVRHVLINAKAEVDEAGNFVRTYSTMVDTTSLKEVQSEIEQNSKKYKNLFDNSNDIIFLRSVDTAELIDANQRALQLLSYNLDELKQIPIQQLMVEDTHPEDYPKFIDQLTKDGTLPPAIRTYIAKNGSRITLEVSYSLITDTDKKPLMMQIVCRDLTESKIAEEQIRKERDFARTAMNSVSVGIIVMDMQGQLEYINPTMSQFVGKTLEQALTQPFKLGYTPESEELVRSVQLHIAATHKSSHYEVQLARHDGQLRTMFINATPRIENDVMTGSINSYMDVTDEKEIENNLRQSRDQIAAANIELEKAVKMKDEFLASMSHELRTPLTGILGLSEVLLGGSFGPVNDKQLSTLNNIVQSGRHLQDLINDILDLSRIEAGKLELYPELVVVEDLCRSTTRLVEGMSGKKNQTIEVEIKQANLKVYADLKRLKQVLVNLLSNAIKFTPEGEQIGLLVEVVPEGNAVRFTVWDKGIGIKPEDRMRIFEPFVQLDGKLSRQFAGTGLGLALVEKFIRMHKGALTVESEEGKGSRFIFTLPWQADEENRLLEAAFNQRESQSNTGFLRTAILAGNFSEVDSKFAVQLRAIGLRVHHAANLAEITQFYERKASMVVITVHNQLMDGRDTWLQAMMSDPRLSGLGIIVIHTNPKTVAQPTTEGITNLAFPVSIKDLRSIVDEIFSNNLLGKGGIVALAKPTNQTAPLKGKFTLLVVEDNRINREMMMDFLKSKNFDVITAENGQEAIDQTIRHEPDLILMDIQMPGMDGIEATHQIRALPQKRLARVPILAVTALAMLGDREKIIAAGCNDYISKPVNLPKLVEVLERILNQPPAALED